jgi:hypothetical protein
VGNREEDDMRLCVTLMAVLALTLCVFGVALADDKANPHEGIVVKAGEGKLTMTDKDGKNEHTHQVARDAQITCDGKQCRLEDLKQGFQIKVTVEKRGNLETATKIEAKKTAG